MPYRNQQFANNEIHHIVIKSIDGNLLFKDIDDYYRGIFSIYEFNTIKPITIRERRKIRAKLKRTDRGRASVVVDREGKLVEILAFCFMPNHIHLLLRQLEDGGITKFMSKLGTGYGGYFNRKYGRKGYVFQDRFRAVHIKNNNQLNIVFVYIHANPISLIEPGWKEKGIKDPNKVIKFLENYKWSSYPDYIGNKNFPSVTNRDFLLTTIGGEKNCRQFVEDLVKDKSNLKEIVSLELE